jgi:predicted enzyme related to lactoylglutathione lyase
MSNETPKPGTIGWHDLTVDDADGVRDFYERVIGWGHDNVSMGEYKDYIMLPPDGEGAVGICHRRGTNDDMPPVWMVYFVVEDVEKSAAEVSAAGGRIRIDPRGLAGGRFCVIEDPAGAVCALYQPPAG